MSEFNLIGGVGIMGFISPKNTDDEYAVIDPIYGVDGLRNVTSISELNSITLDRRRAGMIVGVDDGTYFYKLKPSPWDFTLTDWVEIEFTKKISIDKEIPEGSVDGQNNIFTLRYSPIENTEHVFLNGLLQDYDDYQISGNTITFLDSPFQNSKIKCSYKIF